MSEKKQQFKNEIIKTNESQETPQKFATNSELSCEPAYIELIHCFQNAEWDKCNQLIDELLTTYPDDSSLREIQEDIQVKMIFRSSEASNIIELKKHERKKISFSVLVVIAGVVLGIIVVLLLSSGFGNKGAPMIGTSGNQKITRLLELEEKARNFIRVGNTQLALESLQQISDIDPYYVPLIELESQVKQLQEMDSIYKEAVAKLENGEIIAALNLFKQIELKNPTYKDIKFQIQNIEQQIKVDELLIQADNAYKDMLWTNVISAYEEALGFKPELESPKLEEQLFTSYYETIKVILASDNPSIEDIDTAEEYYYKAVALVAQDKAFTQERRELQQFLVSLLNMKYRQIAKAFIESPNMTEESISKAVDYLRKAVNLAPGDVKINSELDKAQTYLLALQKYNRMEWDSAITNLEKLNRFQSTYANGMVQYMLYESYTARGKRFLNAGYFLDARKDFEKAEISAWEIQDNKLQRFEAELNVGFVMGKMYDYHSAVQYFNLALDSIDINSSVTDSDLIATVQNARIIANSLLDYSSFEAYQEAIFELKNNFGTKEAAISKGCNLASISMIYGSTAQAIRELNGLPEFSVAKSEMEVNIPYIK